MALFFFWHQKQNKKPEINLTSVFVVQEKTNKNDNHIIPIDSQKTLEKPPEIKPQLQPPQPKLQQQKPQPKPQAKSRPKLDKLETTNSNKNINLPISTKQVMQKLEEKKQIPQKPQDTISAPAEIIAKKTEPASEKATKIEDSVGVFNLQVTQQDIEKQLNSTLSKRETFNIQAQFRACYQRALTENQQKSTSSIIVKINLNKDGYIITNLDNIIDKTQYQHNKNYKNSIDNVKKMIEFCNPIVNLAKEKYEIWQEIVLQLNENNNL
jgi:hypothetical protein